MTSLTCTIWLKSLPAWRSMESTRGSASAVSCRIQLQYLGYQIDSSGLHIMPDKLDAIIKAPEPTNVCSFLGLLNYYRKLIPNLPTILHHWIASYNTVPNGSGLRNANTHSKKQRKCSLPLTLWPISISPTGSWCYGVGAVISHVMPDGL